MAEALNIAFDAIDDEHSEESATTRRKLVAGAAGTIGGMDLLGLLNTEDAMAKNDAKTILNIAATAEVLATIVNTVGGERLAGQLDPVTTANIQAAAREELIHFDVLHSIGGRPATRKIWVPDAVFASKAGLLNTLVAGDQIFINAWAAGTTCEPTTYAGTPDRLSHGPGWARSTTTGSRAGSMRTRLGRARSRSRRDDGVHLRSDQSTEQARRTAQGQCLTLGRARPRKDPRISHRAPATR